MRSVGIASPDCYQARNDAMGLFARNDGVGLQARNDGKEEVACDDDTLRKSVTSCSSFNKNSLLTRCKVFIPEGLG